MEERREDKAVGAKYHRKLDYNAPLLSMRRPGGAGGAAALQLTRTTSLIAWGDTSNRVPFSWEKTPGEPKDVEVEDDAGVPPPKLPPARWRPPKAATKVGNFDEDDDGCDGDVEDDEDSDDVVFSDAIDMFSLCESVEKLEAGGLETAEQPRSPSFIIRRFLNDAIALAVSKEKLRQWPRCGVFPGERRSQSSLKGCGTDAFFPWKVKYKPCWMKSPIGQASVNVKAQGRGRGKKKC